MSLPSLSCHIIEYRGKTVFINQIVSFICLSIKVAIGRTNVTDERLAARVVLTVLSLCNL